MRKSLMALAAMAFVGAAPAHASISVVVNSDADSLISNLLGGTGLSIVGGTSSLSSAATAPGATGTFSGASSIGAGLFDAGVILTTGLAESAVGPNSSGSTTTVNGLPGSADLDPLTTGTTQDATILEFDFMTTTGDIFFEYFFASEEYNEFVDTAFNDVFAFFLDGTNIALLPGGDPVTIDNVNLGDNPTLYNSNSSPANGGFDIEYDGFTDVLTATATGLDTSIAHTLSIQIADTGDSAYDSAVFLAAGTLGDEPPVPGIPEPATWMMMLAGFVLVGTAIKRRRRSIHEFA